MSQAMIISAPHRYAPQTFRVGYDMPAMDIAAGKAFQVSHYAAVRSRLLGGRPSPSRPLVRRWSYAPAPLPVLPPDDVEEQQATPTGWKLIVTRVAQRHGLAATEILGHTRRKAVVKARHEAIYHCIVETGMTLPMIGRRFNRDHTTILHSFRKHKASLANGTAPRRDMILTSAGEGATLKQKCHDAVRLVAIKYGVSPAQIYGNQRRDDLFRARQEIFLILYREHGLNYTEIGRGVGDRDHNTVVNAIGHLVRPKAEVATE